MPSDIFTPTGDSNNESVLETLVGDGKKQTSLLSNSKKRSE